MTAVRVGPAVRSVAVDLLRYFAGSAVPVTPHDLLSHRCIDNRLITAEGLSAKGLEKHGQSLQMRQDGILVFNDCDLFLDAVLAGVGVLRYFTDRRQTQPALTALTALTRRSRLR